MHGAKRVCVGNRELPGRDRLHLVMFRPGWLQIGDVRMQRRRTVQSEMRQFIRRLPVLGDALRRQQLSGRLQRRSETRPDTSARNQIVRYDRLLTIDSILYAVGFANSSIARATASTGPARYTISPTTSGSLGFISSTMTPSRRIAMTSAPVRRRNSISAID